MPTAHDSRLNLDDIPDTETHANPVTDLDGVQLSIEANEQFEQAVIERFYHDAYVLPVVKATLDYIDGQIKNGLILPYFKEMNNAQWQQKSKAVDIYVTDSVEGRTLNVEARGKDYATNILSYPSDLPVTLFELMPTLPLGELIICHEVIEREAAEQDKTIAQHISHLLVHGVLHLLGFDHEIGQSEQDQMEQFEIAILASLALPNPYI